MDLKGFNTNQRGRTRITTYIVVLLLKELSLPSLLIDYLRQSRAEVTCSKKLHYCGTYKAKMLNNFERVGKTNLTISHSKINSIWSLVESQAWLPVASGGRTAASLWRGALVLVEAYSRCWTKNVEAKIYPFSRTCYPFFFSSWF